MGLDCLLLGGVNFQISSHPQRCATTHWGLLLGDMADRKILGFGIKLRGFNEELILYERTAAAEYAKGFMTFERFTSPCSGYKSAEKSL